MDPREVASSSQRVSRPTPGCSPRQIPYRPPTARATSRVPQRQHESSPAPGQTRDLILAPHAHRLQRDCIDRTRLILHAARRRAIRSTRRSSRGFSRAFTHSPQTKRQGPTRLTRTSLTLRRAPHPRASAVGPFGDWSRHPLPTAAPASRGGVSSVRTMSDVGPRQPTLSSRLSRKAPVAAGDSRGS
jgi:hypothetical protein